MVAMVEGHGLNTHQRPKIMPLLRFVFQNITRQARPHDVNTCLACFSTPLSLSLISYAKVQMELYLELGKYIRVPIAEMENTSHHKNSYWGL